MSAQWDFVDAFDRLSIEWPAAIVFFRHEEHTTPEPFDYGEFCLAVSRAQMKVVVIVHEKDFKQHLADI